MTSSADPWDERFIHLWPTRIFQRQLPESFKYNPVISSIVLSMEGEKTDLTTDYQGVGFLHRPEPEIAWLRNEITDTLRGYFLHCGISYQVHWDIQAWANVNRLGDYHTPHNHGWSYLSGTYYVDMPVSNTSDAARDKSMSPAAITFSDPRYGAYRHSIAEDPNDQARHTINPKPGTLLMWPASLVHYVHPNHSNEARISISFNVILEWDNQYAG